MTPECQAATSAREWEIGEPTLSFSRDAAPDICVIKIDVVYAESTGNGRAICAS